MKVPRTGFEPVAYSLEGCCSIQLSYRDLSKIDSIPRLKFKTRGSNIEAVK